MEEKLVTIARFDQPWKASEAADALAAEGIQSFSPERLGEDYTPSIWGIGEVEGGIRLQVREADVPRAAQILKQTDAAQDLEPSLAPGQEQADEAEETPFLARQAQLEAKIAEWSDRAGSVLRVDFVTSYSGHKVYALTLSDFSVSPEGKAALYFAQPHAHEPGATAGMIDAIQQLVTGYDLLGEPSPLDVDEVLARTILTFNPIGNPAGRERAPVLCWDGSQYSNEQFWCWMRGEDPDHPGQMWKRLDLWDTREERAPNPVGIVYEPIDEFRYVEPNRSHLSSYFKLFFEMDALYHYERWLDLHQTEFVGSPHDCMALLPLAGLAGGEIERENAAWGQDIVDAWRAAGFRPQPRPEPLGYTGTQADYFRRTWGALHQRMCCISTEVKNNAPDATPEFQLRAQSIAIVRTIERELGSGSGP